MTNPYFDKSAMNRKDFESVLKKGLGRAKLQIMNNGLNDYADIVLNACLHEQTYDPQCESSRADWLLEMFYRTDHFPRFREKIISSLLTETDVWDLQQLFDLVYLIASNNDSTAKNALRNRAIQIAAEPSDHDWIGNEELLKIDKESGLIELSKIYGRRLLVNPDDFVPTDLVFLVEEQKDRYVSILKKMSKSYNEIDSYLKYLQKEYGETLLVNHIDREESKKRHHERVRRIYPIDLIIDNAKNKVGKYPGMYLSFGRHATPQELEQVFHILMNETKESVIIRLLWVFRKVAMPQLHPKLFEWALCETPELKLAAISALSQVTDKKIYEFGKEMVSNVGLIGDNAAAIDLFVNNYGDDIPQLLSASLKDIELDEQEAHSIGFNIVDLAEKNSDQKLSTLLKWVYENTPCTNCRYKAIEHLAELKQLDEALINECKYDASEEIRGFAMKLSKASI